MSLEELQRDYDAIQTKIDGMTGALTTPAEIMALLKNDIVPFMGSSVKELAELDDTVADLYANAEDILQPETAGLFAALILTGRPLLMELQKRLTPADTKIAVALKEWLSLSKSAERTLADITVPDDDEDDDDDDDEDGDEDGDKAPDEEKK